MPEEADASFFIYFGEEGGFSGRCVHYARRTPSRQLVIAVDPYLLMDTYIHTIVRVGDIVVSRPCLPLFCPKAREK